MCFNCDENARALDGVVQQTIPISLYAKPSALRDWLTFYKDDGDLPADPTARRAIGAILAWFLIENRKWVKKLDADGMMVVPSTVRPAPHPLALLMQERGDLPNVSYELTRTTTTLGHNQPNRDAFAVAGDFEGRRIVLLDDVYTSGARAQSAAYALRRAGALVTALIVIGRRYNPTYSDESAAVFQRQAAAAFDWAADLRDATRTLRA